MNVLRLLNIDGGGMKIIYALKFLDMFCTQAQIKPNEIWKHFAFISGTSAGAIAGAGCAASIDPSNMLDTFRRVGPKIFLNALGLDTGPVGPLAKASMLGGFLGPNVPLAGNSFYGEGNWPNRTGRNEELQETLQFFFGDMKMFQLRTEALFVAIERQVVAGLNQDLPFRYRPALFSSMLGPGLEGQNLSVVDAVQASASAPFYFPPLEIPDALDPNTKRLYIDGGVGMNNPSGFLLAYSDLLGLEYDRIVMLSVGCGIGSAGFYDPDDNLMRGFVSDASANLQYFRQMMDVSGGVAQEGMSQQMQILSDLNIRINDADFVYYRFNSRLPMNENTELDNSTTHFCNLMEAAAKDRYDRGQYRISAFINNCEFDTT